jgi:Fe-S-cluster-containing hydrogenase component 2
MKCAECSIVCEYLNIQLRNYDPHEWRFVCKKFKRVLKQKEDRLIKLSDCKEAHNA